MSTSKVNIEDLYFQYPFVGTIIEWNPERGFGKISSDISVGKSYFAHFSGYQGPQNKREISRLNLLSEQCLFAVGVSPHKYDPTRRPQRSALVWILAKDLSENIDSYNELKKSNVTSGKE
jgi:hypothetical protein